MGLRLLIALIVIGLLIWLLRKAFQRPSTPPPVEQQKMLRCAHCGLHIPQGEAVMDGDTPYCCTEHRLAGPRD